VGYVTRAIGVFVLCAGLLAPFVDDRPPHTFADAAGLCALATLVIATGRALLRLRKWASLVIEAFAASIFVVTSVFGVFAIWIGVTGPQASGATVGIGLALLYGLPSFLTVRGLRKVRRRGLLV